MDSTVNTRATLDSFEDVVCTLPPSNHGDSPPFRVLTKLFERLQNERKYDIRRRALETWFKNYREEVGNDFYDVLRLILPQKDRERAVYQVKEKNLAKLFIRAIPLGKTDPDSVRLLNWKKPTDENKAAGDFPAVLYDVLSKRSSVTNTTLSIAEVNSALNELAQAGGKMDKQMSSVQLLYNRCTPADQRWIVRIILKDLLISVKETTVFSVFHSDAQALFNTCSDLKKVAYDLWDPSHILNPEEKSVQLFRAFAPMLCKRPLQSIEASVKKMGASEFIIEEKLDSERIQLHKRGNEYFYCSRKGKDYTYLYGKHVGEGALTPFIHEKAFHEAAEELILDGEMMVYDPEIDRYLPFGNLKTAALGTYIKRRVSSDRDHAVRKLCNFLAPTICPDAAQSLTTRQQNLKHTVIEIKGRIEYATSWRGKSAKDVRDRMEQVMDARGEGLVIKHPHSQYVLNGRNEDWIKVKPEYLDNMGETVDVLVTSGFYGSGKRGGGVSTLVCSVRDDSNGNIDDYEAKYRTFVRIGSGLTLTDYLEIRAKPWKPFDKKHPPMWLLAANKAFEDKGDVYLEPEDSFIIKVKAAEITPSDQYHMGVTMRFPRALAIRNDLEIADCATASDIMESLRKEKKRKLENTANTTSKKRKTVSDKSKVAGFTHRLAPANLDEVTIESTIFKDMKFYVLLEGRPTPASIATQRKHDLESMIVAHGGDFCAGYSHDPNVIILYGGDSKPAPVAMIIRAAERDIIRTKWVFDCVEMGRLIPLRKTYFFFATDARKDHIDYLRNDSDNENDLSHKPPLTFPASTSVGHNLSKDAPDTPTTSSHDNDDEVIPSEIAMGEDPDSETDPESDAEDRESITEVEEQEDFMNTPPPTTYNNKTTSMGETEGFMQYDPDNIFRHLCFYLDTPEGALRNGLKHAGSTDSLILVKTKDKIERNGGRIVELQDPKLTHVIFDPEDTSRRLEIKRLVCRSTERYLIVADWVYASLEDRTLVDERMFDA